MGLPGWPGGDPGKIEDASKAWAKFGTAITNVIDAADPPMQAAFADWEGAAAKKFESTWNDFVTAHRNAAKGAAAIAKQLNTYSEELDKAHKKYEHMVEAMAATAVVGFGLAILTGGLSAAAGAAAEAAVAAEVTELLTELGVEIETVTAIATAAAETVGGAADLAVGAAVNFSIGFAMSAGDQALDSELDGDGFKVEWDKAAIAGLTSAALGPLMDGKALPIRIAIGAGGTGASDALSQLDDLLLHGGAKDGKKFSVTDLVIAALAGGAQGGIAKGPEEVGTSEAQLKSLQKMVDELEDDPNVSSLLEENPDWLHVFATNPEIMKVISAGKEPGATFAVSPTGVTSVLTTVQHTVVEINLPKSLGSYTQDALIRRMAEMGTDLSKEDIKKMIHFEVDEAGGPAAVSQMNAAQLKQLADQIANGVPSPAEVKVH